MSTVGIHACRLSLSGLDQLIACVADRPKPTAARLPVLRFDCGLSGVFGITSTARQTDVKVEWVQKNLEANEPDAVCSHRVGFVQCLMVRHIVTSSYATWFTAGGALMTS